MSETQEAIEISTEELIQGIKEQLSGQLNESIIESTANDIPIFREHFPALGGYWNMDGKSSRIFVLLGGTNAELSASIINGNNHNVGAGYVVSSIYTNEINHLVEKTKHIAYIARNNYFAVLFYDVNYTLMGYFVAPRIPGVSGDGFGPGEWKY